MKKSILSMMVVGMMMLGTVTTSAQTNDAPAAKSSAEQNDRFDDKAGFREHRDAPFMNHGKRGGMFKKDSTRHRRNFNRGFRPGNRHGMGRPGRFGHRQHFNPVKSTPKCKCATCVELRKREEMMQKVEALRKEKQALQHQIDSMRMEMHKGEAAKKK